MPGYNLVDEPWLTVRSAGGRPPLELGIAEVLARAHELEGVVVEFSTQLPAVLRQVLLPVVAHATGAPRTLHDKGQRLSRDGGFTKDELREIRTYLDEHRAQFDLFDPKNPFGQVAGLRTAKDETKGSAALVATAASGNNVPLFASRTDADPLDLTPAQAAHWLVHAHCWDTAAIKTGVVGDDQVKAGKTTGNPTGPLGQLGVIVPTGRTLYETLLLNLPVTPPTVLGVPQWLRGPHGPAWKPRAAEGLLDLWTWQARRIRLVPHEDGSGQLRVARVVISAGDRLTPMPEREPHTAWTFTAPAKKSATARPERRPRRHTQGKAAWRGLDALLSATRQGPEGAFETSVLLDEISGLREIGSLDADYPLQVETFGMVYGTQSAVVEDVLHDSIPLSLLALHQDSEAHELLLDVAEQAEQLARAVNNLSADLRRAAGAEPVPWDKGQRPGEFLLHLLDPLVRRLLAGVRGAGDDEEQLHQGRLAWEEVAHRHAREAADALLLAAPAATFGGRTLEQPGKAGEAAKAGKAGRTRSYSLGAAGANFRRQLDEILPRWTDALRQAAAAREAEIGPGPDHDPDLGADFDH
ncbi:CRISPR system Cascade subunit CasA [Streptomyces sp. TLI_053]|uniref:type I-E CRISPR-associated protein Cse1/CasA n=1 Tax=Streptomyces sp. TLI_053 TaxID=1855352 RepID=UPI000879A076|nr:type I-E CRISPR-associated protein Cse1/CasA [Streptomyces sp. TLI_053]SDT81891.1 CRISPR system Cascade subunit CasA [Streptomyces sp. TLI_053]